MLVTFRGPAWSYRWKREAPRSVPHDHESSSERLVQDPHRQLLDFHGPAGLRVGGWLALEPAADRMGARPAEPPGLPALLHLHCGPVAHRWGRRDHGTRVPAAQGMGVRR